METLRVELIALARCALLHAQQHLEGVSVEDAETPDRVTFSAGDYDAARASLALCLEYCGKLEEMGLDLEQRQQTAARIDEAEAALARGDKRLEEGWVAQEEGALIEARDLLRAATHEFEAAFASHRRTQELGKYEQGLKALESSVYERGLEQLRAAVTQLQVNGDPAAARESIAAANQIFEPLGGYALAAAAAAGREIQLRYFMVAGQKVRENAVGTKEKARMSAQERRAWNQRHLAPAEQPESLLQLQPVLEAAEPGVVGGVAGADEGRGGGEGNGDGGGGGGGGVMGEGVPGPADAGSEGDKKGHFGDSLIVVPTFESMAHVSPAQVEQLLRAVSLR